MARQTKETEIKEKKTVKKKDEKDIQIEMLQAQVDALKTAVENMLSNQSAGAVSTTNISEEYIPVISRVVGELSLSTLGQGQGMVYSIPAFGETIDIPFSDLKQIVMNNRHFVANGYFYILNEQAVKQLRLEGTYEKLISNDILMNLFDTPSEIVIGAYKSCDKKQREIIVDLVQDRMLNGLFVDGNIVMFLEQELGRKLITE